MKLNYELTLDDCKIFTKETFFIKRYFCYFIKDNFRRALICSIILSLIEDYLIFNFNIPILIISFASTFIAIFVAWSLMGYYSGGKIAYRLLNGTDKNYELTIDNDIIKKSSSSSEMTFYWRNIKDIYNTKKNILLFISDRVAIIIPKRIFTSEDDINNCWKYVSSCYHTAKVNK